MSLRAEQAEVNVKQYFWFEEIGEPQDKWSFFRLKQIDSKKKC